MALAQVLEELTGLTAPSGHEEPMIARMRDGFSSAGINVQVDPLGNVIAPLRRPRDGHPHVLVSAHMDEVGFIVTKIEPDGFLRLQRVGGIPEKAMAGQRLLLLAAGGPVVGVIATKAHHVTDDGEKYRVIPITDVFVDVGASSREEALAAGIAVGTRATWMPAFHRRGDFAWGKAMDDRVGCAVLLALAQTAPDIGGGAGVTLVASVQEEFNIRGIIPAVRALRPDVLICLDIVPANDTPDTAHLGDVALGRGPTIGQYSFHGRGTLNGLIPNPKLARFVEAVAQRHRLPLQRHVFFGGLTDASYAQLEGPGIPAIDVGLPTRYTHAPVEACSMNDVETAAVLVRRVLEEIPSGFDLSRGS